MTYNLGVTKSTFQKECDELKRQTAENIEKIKQLKEPEYTKELSKESKERIKQGMIKIGEKIFGRKITL